MKMKSKRRIVGLFLILNTISIQWSAINLSSGFNDDLLLKIMGDGDNGIDEDLIEWLRIPEIKNNSELEAALTSSAASCCLAILDSGLDQVTWSHLQQTFQINFRLFKHVQSTYAEIYSGDDLDLGRHHGSMMCSLIASLLEGYITQILVFQILDEDHKPNNDHIYDALEYIEYLWSQGLKVKVVNMSLKTEDRDTSVESKLLELSSTPYRITFFAGSGNADYDSSEYSCIVPADYHPVLGVGGIIFKDETYEGFRMRIGLGAEYASQFFTRSTARASTPVVVAPGESVEVACNKDGEGGIDAYLVSGTSASTIILSAIAYMIFKIQNYKYPESYVSSSRIYEIICFNSEGDNVDSTRKPAAGNSIIYEPSIGWGGVDFYDYCLYAYEMFTPPTGGGGGGGGPLLE